MLLFSTNKDDLENLNPEEFPDQKFDPKTIMNEINNFFPDPKTILVNSNSVEITLTREYIYKITNERLKLRKKIYDLSYKLNKSDFLTDTELLVPVKDRTKDLDPNKKELLYLKEEHRKLIDNFKNTFMSVSDKSKYKNYAFVRYIAGQLNKTKEPKITIYFAKTKL